MNIMTDVAGAVRAAVLSILLLCCLYPGDLGGCSDSGA